MIHSYLQRAKSHSLKSLFLSNDLLLLAVTPVRFGYHIVPHRHTVMPVIPYTRGHLWRKIQCRYPRTPSGYMGMNGYLGCRVYMQPFSLRLVKNNHCLGMPKSTLCWDWHWSCCAYVRRSPYECNKHATCFLSLRCVKYISPRYQPNITRFNSIIRSYNSKYLLESLHLD